MLIDILNILPCKQVMQMTDRMLGGKGHHLCQCTTQNLPGGFEENCNKTCHDSDL
jgi:hypothetical protein